MPVCQHCGGTWSYKESLKQLLNLRRKMTCEHCNEQQYSTQRSYWVSQMAFLPAYFIIIPLVSIVFNVGFLIGFLAITPLLIFYTLISPKFLTLSNEEEPLW
ncbi:TIGR04104 family putative zinc finger protein [Alkalibacillus haloalkaliphilus]|uniref:TIGR04104 family putative zinc finger protein n=1 Tax=Alkalibacillus haloalkaliphilus TaxID=94136 RepID=UPI0011BEA31B